MLFACVQFIIFCSLGYVGMIIGRDSCVWNCICMLIAAYSLNTFINTSSLE